MSTYTDLHIRKKENLTILRMPGNPYDGMTPQRVIFSNPENIYNGKFVGELSTTSASFNNVTLTDCDIVGGVLSGVSLKYGDQTISLVELTSNVSQNEEDIASLKEFQSKAEASCKTFADDISTLSLSSEWLSGYADKLSGYSDKLSSAISSLSISSGSALSSITYLSSNLSTLSDEFVNYVDLNDKAVSAVSSDLSSLSTRYDGYVEKNDKDISGLSNAISGVSSNLEVSADNLTSMIEAVKKQVAGGVVYKQALSIDYIGHYDHTLPALLSVNGIPSDSALSVGYFYITQTQLSNRTQSYDYDGVKLTHGDWLIIKNDCYASSITSADVDVIDAQDFDNFKLSGNNNVYGDNTFYGNNTFTSASVSQNLSATNAIVDKITAKWLAIDLSSTIYDNVSSLQDLLGSFQTQISDNKLSIGQLISYTKSNDISVSTISTALTTLQDKVDGYISSNDLCVSTISSQLTGLSGELNATSTLISGGIDYLSSELSDYHNTLSGIDRLNHSQNDISSDNLIITDLQPTSKEGQPSHHNRYYMTFLSGTIVLKQID